MPAITEKAVDGEDAIENTAAPKTEEEEHADIEDSVNRHNRRAKDKGVRVFRKRREESTVGERQLPPLESRGSGGSLRQILGISETSRSPDSNLSRGRSRIRRQ